MKHPVLCGYAAVLSVLLLADISWRGWQHFHKEKVPQPRPFSFLRISTNGADGLVIIDSRTKETVLLKLSFSETKSETTSYFFQGKDIMDVHLYPGKLPRLSVNFYDATNGEMKAMWVDRSGLGTFTDRVLYEQEPQMEVWMEDRWQPVVVRDGRRGVVLENTWERIRFTNGAWTTAP